ncbi:MAG: YceI family protein [Nitrospirae bacterium]|nr:YceI family protein [Nitrospirota bacterium]
MAKWIIDPDHSVAAFAIRHMMIAYVHGQLNKISGTIEFDTGDVNNLSMELAIEASSLFTGIGKRDEHLKSEDFFHIGKFPAITFKSTNSEKTGFNTCKVSGDLSIHGITKSIALNFEYLGPVNSPFGETCIGFTASTSLNREDFGMTWNQPLDGGIMVGKDVQINLNLEADLISD